MYIRTLIVKRKTRQGTGLKKALLKKQITKAKTWKKKARALSEYSRELHTNRHRFRQPPQMPEPVIHDEKCRLCNTPYGNLHDLTVKYDGFDGSTEYTLASCNDCYRWVMNQINFRIDTLDKINYFADRMRYIESKGL